MLEKTSKCWKYVLKSKKMVTTHVSELFSKSKSGATPAEDTQHSRHPLMSKANKNVAQVKERVRNFIWVSSEHSERQSNMHRIVTKSVPHLLGEQHKQNCVNTCLDHQGRL
jgi:hypothetical protein